MVFALGKFISLKWSRLLAAFGKSTMQGPRGACVLSVEGDISLPRLKPDILCDGRLVFVPRFPRRPLFDFERDRTESACCPLGNGNACQAIVCDKFEDAFDTPTHQYDLEPQINHSSSHHLFRSIP